MSIQQIPVDEITPSPYQHRKHFDESKLKELSENIQQHGLIQPIVARKLKSGYELVCGERRLRATKLHGGKKILALVREYTDREARMACLSENVQRADLSRVEEIEAIAEWVDAFMDNASDDYVPFLKKQINRKEGRSYRINGKPPDLANPLHRCGYLLALVESDRKNGTAVSSKFAANLEAAFAALKKGVEIVSFATHHMPFVIKLEEFQEIRSAAIEKGLSQSQAESVLSVARHDLPRAMEMISSGVVVRGKTVALEDCSAREIKETDDPWKDFGNKILAQLHTGDQESYTPTEYIEAARAVMGSIDLDPASNPKAQRTVKAGLFYTKSEDGLTKEWRGNVFCNPPYSTPEIGQFISKLVGAVQSGEVPQAVLLTNDNTDTRWFREAANASSVLCFVANRINFVKPDDTTSSPTNGQCFFYFGANKAGFAAEFSKFGILMEVVKL